LRLSRISFLVNDCFTGRPFRPKGQLKSGVSK
jgi:hypothetical protein